MEILKGENCSEKLLNKRFMVLGIVYFNSWKNSRQAIPSLLVSNY